MAKGLDDIQYILCCWSVCRIVASICQLDISIFINQEIPP